MVDEPENLILHLLRDMRGEIADIRATMATKDDLAALRTELKSDMAELRSELKSDIADVASDLLTVRKDLGEQIVGLRRAVVEYHTSVIGHGVLISGLDARLRRVETHLNLSA